MATLKEVLKTKKVQCKWFVGFTRRATDTESHPILGDVPVCEDCKKFCERNK